MNNIQAGGAGPQPQSTSPFYGTAAAAAAAARYAMPTYAPVVYYYSYAHLPQPVVTTQHAPPTRSEREAFYEQLHAFRASIGQPIVRLPTLGFKELDLWTLYKQVTRRNGIDNVIARKQWKEVAEALKLPSSCTDSGFRLRLHYKKYLEAYERKYFKPLNNNHPQQPQQQQHHLLPPSQEKSNATVTAVPNPKKKRRPSTTTNLSTTKEECAVAKSMAADLPNHHTPFSVSTLCSADNNKNISTSLPVPPRKSQQHQQRDNSQASSPPGSSCSIPSASSRSLCTDSQRGETNSNPNRSGSVDFSRLQPSTLKRYASKYGLKLESLSSSLSGEKKEISSQAQNNLVQVVDNHFNTPDEQTKEEAQIILDFAKAVRRRRESKKREYSQL